MKTRDRLKHPSNHKTAKKKKSKGKIAQFFYRRVLQNAKKAKQNFFQQERTKEKITKKAKFKCDQKRKCCEIFFMLMDPSKFHCKNIGCNRVWFEVCDPCPKPNIDYVRDHEKETKPP